MIKLNDHYFVAWLKVVKKYDVEIIDGKINVNMTKEQYTEALQQYNDECKPVLKEIRRFVKQLAYLTPKR